MHILCRRHRHRRASGRIAICADNDVGGGSMHIFAHLAAMYVAASPHWRGYGIATKKKNTTTLHMCMYVLCVS